MERFLQEFQFVMPECKVFPGYVFCRSMLHKINAEIRIINVSPKESN